MNSSDIICCITIIVVIFIIYQLNQNDNDDKVDNVGNQHKKSKEYYNDKYRALDFLDFGQVGNKTKLYLDHDYTNRPIDVRQEEHKNYAERCVRTMLDKEEVLKNPRTPLKNEGSAFVKGLLSEKNLEFGFNTDLDNLNEREISQIFDNPEYMKLLTGDNTIKQEIENRISTSNLDLAKPKSAVEYYHS